MNPEQGNVEAEDIIEYYRAIKAKYTEQPTPTLKNELDIIGKRILDITGEDDLSFIDLDTTEENILKNMPPEMPVN